MDEKKKRKDWIKNIAIVFLAVLLILTFCSNTIMNYSLPKVAAQYPSSGSITKRVRGTGYVEAEDPYKVVFKQSRKVASVVAHVGDEVQKGDVLYLLEEGESETLKELRKKYETYVLTHTVSDAFSKGNVNADDFEANLAKLEEARKKVANLEKALENLTTAKDRFEHGTAAEYAEYAALADAQKWKEAWTTQNGINEGNLSDAKSTFDYDSKKQEYDRALNFYNMAKAEFDVAVKALAAYSSDDATYATAVTKGNEALAAYKDKTSARSAESKADDAKTAATAAKGAADTNLTQARSEYSTAVSNPDPQDVIDAKLAAKNRAEAAKNAATTLETKADTLKTKAHDLISPEDNLRVAENGINSYQANVNTSTAKIKEMEAAVAAAQKAIDDKLANYTKQITATEKNLTEAKEELTNFSSDVQELAPLLKEIAEAEKEETITEITAPVSGTVVSLGLSAGETIETGAEVATIQVAGKGFSMSLTVPNEQAMLVNVGDEAEITNSWWYVDAHARVSSIRSNPSNPSKEKIINFQVEGDVSAGQSLSVTVGSRTSNYDIIVPSSAIRDGNDGKYILIVKAKSTPLGNRYIAEKVPVKVLAEDDTRTAISGEMEGWEYVITTASQPIEDGQQVRLKE